MRGVFLGLLTTVAILAACSPDAGSTAATSSGASGSETASAAGSAPTGGRLAVVAAENFWGSLAQQLGGDRVQVTSIITNPATDPHDYEPTPADARRIASARYVIINGAGYDPWALKLVAANPVRGRKILNAGDLAGKKDGDNPHLWYNPDVVTKVIDQISADYQALDPADATYFQEQRSKLDTVGLQTYHTLIARIKQQYAGTPVGSTESVFVYMATALGLQLLSPPGFMRAISDGDEPTAADKAMFDQEVSQHQIKVLIYNKQNATPDTDGLVQRARAAGVPVVAVTETLDPASATFQDWQDAQLQALQRALATATGH